jgi:hypothetical protein
VYNKNFRFVAAHYRSFLRLSLVDALTGRKIGQAIVSAYSLLQRDADVHNGDWRRASLEKLAMRDVNNVERVGHFSVRLAFEEDSKGLFSGGKPRAVAAEPPEQWSVERFQTHIARFKALISLFTDWYSEYCRIMEWENRLLTLSLFVVFVWATLKVDAEYALCCPLFALVVLLTLSWRRRFNGQYKQYWISRGAALALTDTRPAAVLRISVLGFRNMPDSGSGSGGSGSSGAGAAAGSAGSAGGVAGVASSLVASVGAAVSSLSSSAASSTSATGAPSNASSSSMQFAKQKETFAMGWTRCRESIMEEI